MKYQKPTEMYSIKLSSELISGETIEFMRRHGGFSPGKFTGKVYVQAYRRGYPYAAGKTKAEAIREVRSMMAIEKKFGR